MAVLEIAGLAFAEALVTTYLTGKRYKADKFLEEARTLKDRYIKALDSGNKEQQSKLAKEIQDLSDRMKAYQRSGFFSAENLLSWGIALVVFGLVWFLYSGSGEIVSIFGYGLDWLGWYLTAWWVSYMLIILARWLYGWRRRN